MYTKCLHRITCQSHSLINLSVRNYWYRRGYIPSVLEPGKYPFPKRQVPEIGKLSLEERFRELHPELEEDREIEEIDIGLPHNVANLFSSRRFRKNSKLETLARKRGLVVPIEQVHAFHEDSTASLRRKTIAEHFGIFDSLFGKPHTFFPVIDFQIDYLCDAQKKIGTDESCHVETQPVFHGNLLSATMTMNEPVITLSNVPQNDYWTLVMTCPDEPISVDDNKSGPANEYIHWMISNMNNESGDEIVPYLPALPYQGSGFHRYIFILYRQDRGKIDLSKWRIQNTKGNLYENRAFNTLEFYRSLQSELTPGGLLFFQSFWDQSVRHYYREFLKTEEPVFELVWPDRKLPPQEKYPEPNWWMRPRRHPHGIPLINERFGAHNDVSFNVYLDRYRDRKEMFEEIVKMRLKQEGNPLDPADTRRIRYEYPAAIPMPENMPSWWCREEHQRRLRQGRWKYLEGDD